MGRKLLPLLLRIGFGFIKDLQTQESVFIHASKLSEAINEKDKVALTQKRNLKVSVH
jgi:cold shock CspA family protein